MSSLSWMSSSGLSTSVHGLQRARSSAPSRNKTSSVHEQNPCSCCLHSLSLVRRMGTMIRKQNVSVKEIVHAYVEKILATDTTTQSFTSLTADSALQQAEYLDSLFASGLDPGPLAGVPFAIKDNICYSGSATTAGSKLLEKHQPAYDAHVLSALRASGALIIGKTNMDEFGMGSTTENSAFQLTLNPWDLTKVPGGSSGGSAAAVVMQQCALALGSDTGGSIRQPASFCGVVGLKPTYGLLSRHGLIAYASSFDSIGPLSSSVEDTAIALSALCSSRNYLAPDTDATLQHLESFPYQHGLLDINCMASRPLSGKRFAIVKETLDSGVDDHIRKYFLHACKEIEQLGAVVDIVSCPTFLLGLPAYYILALSEASSNLARYDTLRVGKKLDRSAGLGVEVKRRILMGSYALSAGHSDAYYKRAQMVQQVVAFDLASKLKTYDALLTPAAPTAAYCLENKVKDPLSMFSGDMLTVNVNLSGLPAIVVRSGLMEVENECLPFGLQFIGRPFREDDLLKIAHEFELCTWNALNDSWSFR